MAIVTRQDDGYLLVEVRCTFKGCSSCLSTLIPPEQQTTEALLRACKYHDNHLLQHLADDHAKK